MTQKSIIYYLLTFLGYMLLQAALLNKLVIGNMAFCFFYIGFILFLPSNTDKLVQLLIGFLVGLIIDIFGDTLGMHTISCVLLMFIRPYWIQISLGDQIDTNAMIGIQEITLPSLLIFAMPLIFIHHSAVFLLDTIGSGLRADTFFRILTSTIFTLVVLYLIQLFLSPNKKK